MALPSWPVLQELYLAGRLGAAEGITASTMTPAQLSLYRAVRTATVISRPGGR